MNEALLIIDVQNDFLPGGSLPIPKGNFILPIINELQTHFDFIVATKDWHPANHCSFASTHGKTPGQKCTINGYLQELWPNHCLQGTKGAEFPSDLDIKRIKKIFYKGINPSLDSYSAFYDNQHLRSTGLAEYLRENKIDTLYIVGLATDYCVKFSVLDALLEGFTVFVIEDGCLGINLQPKDIENAFNQMKESGAVFLTSWQFLEKRK
jgi:nicotinamidase/pyrazinamidase